MTEVRLERSARGAYRPCVATSRRARPRQALGVAGVAAVLALLATATPALAGDLVVTSTADRGAGTLRAALERANLTGDRNRIRFALPGSGVRTIRLATPLPALTRPVVVDGYTQAGARPSTAATTWNGRVLVELVPARGALPHGLRLLDRSILVRGLALSGFEDAVLVEGPAARTNVVAGNLLGTDPTGTVARGNGTGVRVTGGAARNLVGGPTAADRNVVSGNRDAGVVVSGRGTDRNRIENNLIGPAAHGGRLRGEHQGQDTGVVLADDATRTSVGAGSTRSLGRGGNTIAFAADDGVLVGGTLRGASDLTDGHAIRFNSIVSNGGDDATGLGINLDPGLQTLSGPGELGSGARLPYATDVSVGDDADVDTGPNDDANAPLLASVSRTGDSARVQGSLVGERAAEYAVDVYASRTRQAESPGACDASGHGEAERWLATVTVRTDRLGAADFAVEVSGVRPGDELVATATKTRGGDALAPAGSTSELSPCSRVP